MNNLKACNIGLDIIPYNGISYNGQPIHIVTWSGDKQCGIFRNQFNWVGQQCRGNGYFGNVIEYNQSDINCKPNPDNMPLDSFESVLLLAVSAVALIKKKKLKIVL